MLRACQREFRAIKDFEDLDGLSDFKDLLHHYFLAVVDVDACLGGLCDFDADRKSTRLNSSH